MREATIWLPGIRLLGIWLLGLAVLAGAGWLAVRLVRRRRSRPRRPAGAGAGSGRGARDTTGTTGGVRRPPRAGKPATGGEARRPQPGEIWWADVPYEDGPGHKVRPCLVLRSGRRRTDVLKITSQDRSDRDDHVRIPTGTWDPRARHDSYLDLSDPFRLPGSAFVRRAGRVDAATWRVVREQHATGPAGVGFGVG